MNGSKWSTIQLATLDPHIRVLTMCRPDQRNAINAEMARELEDCLIRPAAFRSGADQVHHRIDEPPRKQCSRGPRVVSRPSGLRGA